MNSGLRLEMNFGNMTKSTVSRTEQNLHSMSSMSRRARSVFHCHQLKMLCHASAHSEVHQSSNLQTGENISTSSVLNISYKGVTRFGG